MKISNLASLLPLLKKEVIKGSKGITNFLTVATIEEDAVVVASSVDADVLLKLRGVTGFVVGAKLAIDTTNGHVLIPEGTELSSPAVVTAPAKQATPPKGCSDRSSIRR